MLGEPFAISVKMRTGSGSAPAGYTSMDAPTSRKQKMKATTHAATTPGSAAGTTT